MQAHIFFKGTPNSYSEAVGAGDDRLQDVKTSGSARHLVHWIHVSCTSRPGTLAFVRLAVSPKGTFLAVQLQVHTPRFRMRHVNLS